MVPSPTGKSPLLCAEFQGHATFSRETSKEKALITGGRPKAGLRPPRGFPSAPVPRLGSVPQTARPGTGVEKAPRPAAAQAAALVRSGAGELFFPQLDE